MGYKRPTTVYKLVFDDRDGLEVRAASVPLGGLMELSGQAEQLRNPETVSFDAATELFELFAKSLRSWNLEEDDGAPVPATLESVLSLEFVFATEILLAWFDAVASVPAPLAKRSTAGSTSAELSIPMETLSESQ